MAKIASSPLWAKVLYGTLIAYSLLLCGVSLSTFYEAIRHGWALKADDIILQTLMTAFLPLLLMGLRNLRLASGLLFAAVAIDLVLLFTLNGSTGDSIGSAIVGSLLFLGVPMLGGAIFLHSLTKRSIQAAAHAASLLNAP